MGVREYQTSTDIFTSFPMSFIANKQLESFTNRSTCTRLDMSTRDEGVEGKEGGGEGQGQGERVGEGESGSRERGSETDSSGHCGDVRRRNPWKGRRREEIWGGEGQGQGQED
eukprot:487819-Hanusia_phi.AAC.2